MPETHRVFFALWPDAAAAVALHGAARAAHDTCGGRLMRRETLHLTLAFLGEVSQGQLDQAQAVADAIAAEPFAFAIDRVGYWKHNRILWAGAQVPLLTDLATRLTAGLRAAGFTLDERPFAAHVTLLRNARCHELPLVLPAIAWPVTEFLLVESRPSPEGSRYEAIGRWHLDGGDAKTGAGFC